MLSHLFVGASMFAYGYIAHWLTILVSAPERRGFDWLSTLVGCVWPGFLLLACLFKSFDLVKEFREMRKWRKQQMQRYGVSSWKEYLSVIETKYY